MTRGAETSPMQNPPAHHETDEHIGAIEGDRPEDEPQQGNPNAPGLDDQGMPEDMTKICEDVIGANVDESTG
jgi:hypothetical protein